jgi:hypothetical protein
MSMDDFRPLSEGNDTNNKPGGEYGDEALCGHGSIGCEQHDHVVA